MLKRKHSDENDNGNTTGTDTGNSFLNAPRSAICEICGGSNEKIPHEILDWKEEHIQRLNILVQYQENITPSELFEKYTLRQPPATKTFLSTYLDKIEDYFLERCLFHHQLDQDITTISRNGADILRNPALYSAEDFISKQRSNPTEAMLQYWQKFATYGIRFAECLYFTILKRDLNGEYDEQGNRKIDPLTEYDFQFLFDAFVNMFGLRSFKWFSPCIKTSKMRLLPHCEVTGKANLLYCQDIAPSINRPLDTLNNIVAVCKVTKNFKETVQLEADVRQDETSVKPDKSSVRQDDSSVTSSSCPERQCLPPHISPAELSQHVGELLLYSERSVTADGIFGIFVQETKVSFTVLKITAKELKGIELGHFEKTKPKLLITKPYDFMKKEERKHIIKPLLHLAMIQEMQLT